MSELAIQAIDWGAALLALAGALFFLISAIGLLRLPDFYCRIHAPTKAATLGVILLGLSSVLRSLGQGNLVWVEDLAILLFLFLTVPVSSQVLARAARRSRVPAVDTEGERPISEGGQSSPEERRFNHRGRPINPGDNVG